MNIPCTHEGASRQLADSILVFTGDFGSFFLPKSHFYFWRIHQLFTRALEIILIEYKYRHALLKIIYLIEWTEEREKEIIIEKCKSFVLTKKKERNLFHI